jgi:cytochrome c-type biogenesis protein CcmF
MSPDFSWQLPSSPIATLGTVTLLIGFLVAAYAAAAGIAGQRQRRPGLVASALYASWAWTALMTFASCLIVYAFLSHDFRIKYVAHYSDSSMPLFYLLTAYWGGLDGSLLFWVWVLSIFSAAALWVNRTRQKEMIGYVVATISLVAMFFIALLLYSKNPFTTFLTGAPAEGRGLNPLLQNYWMVIHPPSLYVGYVGMTIPFAFCMGALASGRLDDGWLHAVRVWVIIPWFFLSFGLILGCLWAYEELGWGGYWAWDPVENAGLIPWFTATAFLHSVVIQERRGMLKTWNVVLIIVTFFLTIFGTFMTRSGIVQSVHAFGQDNELALLFLLFMTAVLVFSIGLLIYRLPALRAANEFESFLSREFAFLLNNVALFICAFFVLFATMFPTLSEYILGQRITVGPPFFNRFMVPIGLMLLLLTGIGPLLAWRVTTSSRLVREFLFPIAAMVVTMGALAVFVPAARLKTAILTPDLLLPMPLIAFGLVAFTVATITQEFWKGASVRRRETGSDPFTALIGVVVTKRRKYGGYVVHFGIAMMFFGFIGKAYQQEKSVTLDTAGKTFELGGYQFLYEDLQVGGNANRDTFIAKVSVSRDGDHVGDLYPGRFAYKHGNKEVTTEVDMTRGMGEDVYLVINGFDPDTKQANFTAYVNPLTNFIWLGFGFFALGTAICLLPASLLTVFAPRRRPGTAALTTILVLLGCAIGLAAISRPRTPDFGPGAVLVVRK